MKLGELEALATSDDEPIAWPINGRNGKPLFSSDGKTRCTINLLGSESKVYRAMSPKAIKRITEELNRKGASDEEIHQACSIGIAACAVKGWAGFETEDGGPLPCTRQNVEALLSYGFILNQVQLGIARHAGFFDDESSPSSPGSEATSV